MRENWWPSTCKADVITTKPGNPLFNLIIFTQNNEDLHAKNVTSLGKLWL